MDAEYRVVSAAGYLLTRLKTANSKIDRRAASRRAPPPSRWRNPPPPSTEFPSFSGASAVSLDHEFSSIVRAVIDDDNYEWKVSE